jgi:hypothetical protein
MMKLNKARPGDHSVYRAGESVFSPLPARTCGYASYSTVTDFARLRGWSTSVPMNTAV